MNMTLFMERLNAQATNKAQMCRDLDIVATTAMRWRDAPGYAVAYLIALEQMDQMQTIEYRHRIAVSRMDAQKK